MNTLEPICRVELVIGTCQRGGVPGPPGPRLPLPPLGLPGRKMEGTVRACSCCSTVIKATQELGEKLILSVTEMEIHCPVPSGQHQLAFFASIFPSSAFHFCDVLLIICSLEIIFLAPVFCYTNSHIKGNVRVNRVVQRWKERVLL